MKIYATCLIILSLAGCSSYSSKLGVKPEKGLRPTTLQDVRSSISQGYIEQRVEFENNKKIKTQTAKEIAKSENFYFVEKVKDAELLKFIRERY